MIKQNESIVVLPSGDNKEVPTKKIVQDLRFLQQFFGKMPDHGNQVIVVNIGEVSGGANGTNGEANKAPVGLIEYIELLPQPRLKNLIREACRVSVGRCGTQSAGADFLGTTRRVVGLQVDNLDELELDSCPVVKVGPKEKRFYRSEGWRKKRSEAMKEVWAKRKIILNGPGPDSRGEATK